MQADPEHPLDAGPIHPARRTCIPCPAAAAHVSALFVHVGARDVWLDLVAIDGIARTRMVDRVQEGEELGSFISVTKYRKRDDRPERSMGVLTAVLTNAGRIGLDIPWVERRSVERGAKEPDNLVAAIDESGVDRCHRRRGTRPIACA